MKHDIQQHIIVCESRHGNGYYPCTLAMAKKLVEDELAYSGQALLAAEKELSAAPGHVRPASWLSKALTEVATAEEQPRALRTVLYGKKPTEGEDSRPEVHITSSMREELLLACFRKGQPMPMRHEAWGLDMLQELYQTLSFLEPSRQRLTGAVRLVETHIVDSLSLLKAIQNDTWKESSLESSIVRNYHCELLNVWAQGTWSVQPLGVDAEPAKPVITKDLAELIRQAQSHMLRTPEADAVSIRLSRLLADAGA